MRGHRTDRFVDDIVKFAQDKSKTKPLVLCEYIHAMGTGPGNIKEYIDAFYEHEKLQGGWVWEWANHGLLTKTKDGKEFYGYGGDFGDQPNDYNFVMDGVLNSDHTPRSALLEYKKAVEPVQLVTSDGTAATIINRLDFVTLDSLRCTFSVTHEGEGESQTGEVKIPDGIGPGQTGTLACRCLILTCLTLGSELEASFHQYRQKVFGSFTGLALHTQRGRDLVKSWS